MGPYYQRTLEPHRVRFVLATGPSGMELAESMAVAAILGDLTSHPVVNGTTSPGLPGRPDWLTPLVAGMGLAVVSIFTVAIWQNLRRTGDY